MTRVKFVILAVLLLAFGTVQCVASCTATSCDSAKVPPCHKHRPTVAHQSCGQDFVRSDSGFSPAASTVMSPGLAPAAIALSARVPSTPAALDRPHLNFSTPVLRV
ncbi:MAG: hypothetical protein JO307_25160 [Bryobacterales bacterium]|nr:hypothetical protein [Bryobacterales bacterium]MBV9401747.1 hypothetical protein [Bryobacterales bacterium]